MNSLLKKIEVIANVAIIAVAILLGVVLVRSYLWRRPAVSKSPDAPAIAIGTRLSIPGVDWKANKRTLVMALSTQCHFCTDSTPFYKQLLQQRGNDVRILAVFPQPIVESEEYLSKLGITTDETRQAALAAINVNATPTLLLTDDQGVVINSWLGKLSPDKEAEVLTKLR